MSLTISIPITTSSSSSVIPRTPRVTRPIGLASSSRKRIDLPCLEASSTSCLPSVSATVISLSSSSRFTAMMPPARGWEYSSSGVFFTTPSRVAIMMNLSSVNSFTGRMAEIFSFGERFRRLTIALPRVARPPSGISYTLSQ